MFGRRMTGCSWAGEVVILKLKKVCFDFQSFTLEFTAFLSGYTYALAYLTTFGALES
jgi:hypothetical protein